MAKPAAIIETPRLILRNWYESDRPLFHEINSDPVVMEYFPMRRTRQEADSLMDKFERIITDNGFGFFALEDRASGEVLGFTGLLKTDLEPYIPRDTLEIGWRLPQRYWGKGYVSEAAQACLAHAFNVLDQREVVAFAVQDNHRSTAVMQRLGMTHNPQQDFDHPKVPDTHPQLKRHVLYRISKDQWLNQSRKNSV